MRRSTANKGDFAVLRFDAFCCGTLKLALKATRITGPYSPPLQKLGDYCSRPGVPEVTAFFDRRKLAFALLCAFAEMIIGARGQRFNSWSGEAAGSPLEAEDLRAAIQLARSFSRRRSS
jgi:hypothetical protein